MFCTTSRPETISANYRSAGHPRWTVRIEGYCVTRTHVRRSIEGYDAADVWAPDADSARILAVSRTMILDGSRRAVVSRVT